MIKLTHWSNVKKLVYYVLVLCLLFTSFGPIPAKAAAPTPPTPTTQSIENQIEDQIGPTPPVVDSPQFEEARARESMESALKKYLDYLGPRYQTDELKISLDGDWALGTTNWASEEKLNDSPVNILAKRQQDGSWLALLPNPSEEFIELLNDSPKLLVSDELQDEIQFQINNNTQKISFSDRADPFTTRSLLVSTIEGNPVFQFPTRGTLGDFIFGSDSGKHYGVDIIHPQDAALGDEVTVYPVYPGDVYAKWTDFSRKDVNGNCNRGGGIESVIVIYHSDINLYSMYFHMGNESLNVSYIDSSIHVGDKVGINTRLGKMGNRIYNPCTEGESYGAVFHHHFAVTTSPISGKYGIDPTPYFPGYHLKAGDDRTPKGTYVSPGATSPSCSAPSITAPPSDFVSISQTITFVWNQTACSGQNGYYLRVGTSSGGNDIVNDYYVEGLQTNYEFGSQWYNRDLYWSVRTNATGAEWSGSRHFRIEQSTPSCSPNADQIALFLDGDYHGQCVVKGVGDYSNPSAIGLPNDQISSIKVGSNVQALLCKHDDYVECETILSDDPNLGDNSIGNDSVSSVKVESRVQFPSIPVLETPGYGTVFTEGETVTLSWSATGTQYYGEIWGGSSQINFGPQDIPSVNVTSILPAGYNYEWHIKAQNSAGSSDWSSSSLFTIKPKTPTSLSATEANCSQINLNWSDNSSNEEGYRIYRNGTAVATVGAGVTSFQNTGLSGNTSYTYFISAYRGSIESDSSNQVSPTTSSCATVPPSPSLVSPSDGSSFIEGQSIVLSWSATGNQYSGEIWSGSSQVNFGPQSGTSNDVTSSLSAGYTYEWHVNAQNTEGTSSWSSPSTFTVLPGTPTNLIAQSPACDQVNLSWEDRSGNEEGFYVYRDGVEIIPVGANGTSVVDTGLSGDTIYSYTVIAYRGSIESDSSNTASVKTQTCVLVDNEKPVVDWVLPVGNEQSWSVGDELIELTVSATDNVGVVYVQFFRWDAVNLVDVEIGYAYTSPYTVTVDCSELNIGGNEVIAVAHDAAGNNSDWQFIWLDRQEPKPDLVPFAPEGYAEPVVISSIRDTSESNELHANQTSYFDVHFANTGSSPAGPTVIGELRVDDIVVLQYPTDNLFPWDGDYRGFTDWEYLISSPGWHFVELIVDPDNLIVESDETNNWWGGMFYWTASAPYFDDLETGDKGWVSSGLWHLVDDSSQYANSSSGVSSWWYGQEDTGNYDTGETNSGDLTTLPIFIPETEHYYLRSRYWYQTESKYTGWDQRWIQASLDGGEFFNVLQLADDNMVMWHNSPVLDLGLLGGHTLQIRYHFDTLDALENAYQGWYIDDFEISTNPPPTCVDNCEYNDSIEYATPIVYGETLSADICANGDYDYYSFAAMAGDAIVVDIDARINGSYLDSFISLLASDGSILSSNDDDRVTVDSKLGYVIEATGTYYLRVRDYGHPSNGGPEFFYNIKIDTDQKLPISAEITSPVFSEWLNTSLQTITATANDLESGISRIEFLWHSADWENEDWIWLGSDYGGVDGWSLNFDTSSLIEQQGAAFYIEAFDFAGNYLGAGSWNLGIDRTPPDTNLNATGMYGGAPFRDFDVVVEGSDNLSGIASYDVQVRDGLDGIWTDVISYSSENYFYYVGENGHTYYFRSRARDLAGNEGIYSEGDGQTSYTVQVCPVDADIFEEDDSATQAKTIVVGDTPQAHNFHEEGDQDWVSFTTQKDKVYLISTVNTGTYADTVIHLFSTDGTSELMFNDDYEGGNYGSQIYWQAPTSGTYYLQVNHWDWYAYGCTTAYTLAVIDITESYPFITSISPNTVAAGSGEINISVEGLNLVSGSVVKWNGIDLVTAYQNDNLLVVTIPAELILLPGVAEITVFSPALGGITSNVVWFTIEGYTLYLPIIDK